VDALKAHVCLCLAVIVYDLRGVAGLEGASTVQRVPGHFDTRETALYHEPLLHRAAPRLIHDCR
jgi:hypothetical protein